MMTITIKIKCCSGSIVPSHAPYVPHMIFFQSNGEFMRFSNYVREVTEKLDLLMINSNKTANMRRYPSTD